MVRYQEGDLERSAAAHQRAIDIFSRDPTLVFRLAAAGGLADHPMLAAVHLGTAAVHERLGNLREAETQIARARQILDTSLASSGANPRRILARRRAVLAGMGAC